MPVDLYKAANIPPPSGGMVPSPQEEPVDLYSLSGMQAPKPKGIFETGALGTINSGVEKFANSATLGLGNKIAALTDALTHNIEGDTYTERYDNALNKYRQHQEEFKTEHPIDNAALDFAGTLAGPGKFLKAPKTIMEGVTQLGKWGGVYGGAQAYGDSPNEGLDASKETLQGVGSGVVTGSVLGGALGTLGRALSPNVSPAINKVMENGGKPSLGQLGNFVEDEKKLGTFPGFSSTVDAAHKSATQGFYRSALNEALAPTGETIDKATPLGTAAVKQAADKLEAVYEKFGNVKGIAVDPVRDFAPISADLTATEQEKFANIIKTEVADKLTDGTMTGAAWKAARKRLTDIADGYETREDGDAMAAAVQKAQNVLHESLANSVPEAADLLRGANSAWMNMNVIKRAATYPDAINEKGVFNPQQFIRAVAAKGGQSRFATGQAPMQPFAQSMLDALGQSGQYHPVDRLSTGKIVESLVGKLASYPYAGVQGVARAISQPRPGLLDFPRAADAVNALTPAASAEAARLSPWIYDKPKRQ